jgi:hypothetical protein
MDDRAGIDQIREKYVPDLFRSLADPDEDKRLGDQMDQMFRQLRTSVRSMPKSPKERLSNRVLVADHRNFQKSYQPTQQLTATLRSFPLNLPVL